ncbi:MAG TPA: cysteine--tRNA ligase [Candidatus Nitrosotalea sp.]|nr:cysteine--tRNA ligase [Candidatus Nitrosotalea sp.]
MTKIHVFNTLGRELQEFVPLREGEVGMYTCGPTVYRYAHIGNFRTYLMADLWIRAFEYFGYRVQQVQNITDVGHLQDDSDSGEDKVLVAAEAERKTPEEIAEFYTAAFLADAALLRIRRPDHLPRATDYVPKMIELVRRLEELGLTYKVGGSVFYDVSRRADYPKLSRNRMSDLRGGHRIAVDAAKHNPADFLLWKEAGPRRLQVWDSPWGPGFPGWHIECSAMSLDHFPNGIDVHTGGVDLVFPHHEDEIAQSEPVYGGRVVTYWIHGEHLLMGGRKMAKSAGNIERVWSLVEQGHDPLAFRYLTMSTRYRSKLRYTPESLEAAERGLSALRQRASRLAPASELKSPPGSRFQERFEAALAADLDLPQVPPLIQELLHSQVPSGEQRWLLQDWDRVLQLGLLETAPAAPEAPIPAPVLELSGRRDQARADGQWQVADELRAQIEALGYSVVDTKSASRLSPR